MRKDEELADDLGADTEPHWADYPTHEVDVDQASRSMRMLGRLLAVLLVACLTGAVVSCWVKGGVS